MKAGCLERDKRFDPLDVAPGCFVMLPSGCPKAPEVYGGAVRFKPDVSGRKKMIDVGDSYQYAKTIDAPAGDWFGYKCPTQISRANWAVEGRHRYSRDVFTLERSGAKMTLTRNSRSPWNYDLRFACVQVTARMCTSDEDDEWR